MNIRRCRFVYESMLNFTVGERVRWALFGDFLADRVGTVVACREDEIEVVWDGRPFVQKMPLRAANALLTSKLTLLEGGLR